MRYVSYRNIFLYVLSFFSAADKGAFVSQLSLIGKRVLEEGKAVNRVWQIYCPLPEAKIK